MQNQQLMPGQTNLQQSSNNLQQVGTPATSSDTTSVLNQPLQTQLTVQSSATETTDTPQTYVPQESPLGWILFGLLLFVVVATAFIWNKVKNIELDEPSLEPIPSPVKTTVPKPAAQVAKKRKVQKKTTRRQRATKS